MAARARKILFGAKSAIDAKQTTGPQGQKKIKNVETRMFGRGIGILVAFILSYVYQVLT